MVEHDNSAENMVLLEKLHNLEKKKILTMTVFMYECRGLVKHQCLIELSCDIILKLVTKKNTIKLAIKIAMKFSIMMSKGARDRPTHKRRVPQISAP